jgi:hypothetical protein
MEHIKQVQSFISIQSTRPDQVIIDLYLRKDVSLSDYPLLLRDLFVLV